MTRRRLVSAGITTQSRPPKVIRDWFEGGPETIAAYIHPEHEFVRGGQITAEISRTPSYRLTVHGS
jgi:hypothetical protein